MIINPNRKAAPKTFRHGLVSWARPNPKAQSLAQGVGAFPSSNIARRGSAVTESLDLAASVKMPITSQARASAARLPLTSKRYSDAHQIVAYLNELAFQYAQNPAVRSAAIQILHHFRVGNNQVSKQVSAFTQWVKGNVVYVGDPEDAEYVISPIVMIRNIEESGKAYGDCDDHALLLGTLIKSVGVPCKIIGVSLNDPNRYDHVIVSVRLNGQWRDIDPCAKEYGQPRYLKRLEPR